MYSNRLAGIGALALTLLIGVGSAVSHARQGDDGDTAKNDKGPGSIGVVDMERIFNASDAPNVLAQKANQIEADAQQRMQSIQAVPQLTIPELQEYGDLVALAAPDAKQQQRIKEMQAISDKRVDRYNALSTKPGAELSAADKAEMHTLREQSTLVAKIMPGLMADLRGDVALREDAVKRSLIANLRVEVGKVAQEKKVAHVFDTGALVYSTNDLTQAVIQKVKKK